MVLLTIILLLASINWSRAAIAIAADRLLSHKSSVARSRGQSPKALAVILTIKPGWIAKQSIQLDYYLLFVILLFIIPVSIPHLILLVWYSGAVSWSSHDRGCAKKQTTPASGNELSTIKGVFVCTGSVELVEISLRISYCYILYIVYHFFISILAYFIIGFNEFQLAPGQHNWNEWQVSMHHLRSNSAPILTYLASIIITLQYS